MKVLHISYTDYGGAGTASYRLHKLMQSSGFESCLIVKQKLTKDSSVYTCPYSRYFDLYVRSIQKVESKLKLFDDNYYFNDRGRNYCDSSDVILETVGFVPDVIVIHWNSGFISLDAIQDIVRKYGTRVFWYMMDMAPMTGGCHFAWDCEGYQQECISCPAINKGIYSLLPNTNLMKKMEFVNTINCIALYPSSHVYRQLSSSAVFSMAVKKELMLPVNEEIFAPDPVYSGSWDVENEIEHGTIKVLFASPRVSEKRKGGVFFQELINNLDSEHKWVKEKVVFVVAGSFNPDEFDFKGFRYFKLGYLNGDYALSKAYALSDVMLSLSIEDSGPMMINEAVMCGLPVIAFDMGVAKDLIEHGKNGYVCELKSVSSFLKNFVEFVQLDDITRNDFSDYSRTIALKKISHKAALQRINKLFSIKNER